MFAEAFAFDLEFAGGKPRKHLGLRVPTPHAYGWVLIGDVTWREDPRVVSMIRLPAGGAITATGDGFLRTVGGKYDGHDNSADRSKISC